MAQNIPFLFGAGGGPPAPAPPSQHQHIAPNTHQQPNGIPSQAQQAAFLQNAQIPGMDMSALNGISPEQLALIGQLFQSGALNLPQIPIPAQMPAPTAAAASVPPSATQAHAQAAIAPPTEEDVEMDKEEGELEEGEELEAGREREFLRPPPTGPRKRSASPRDQYGRADRRASFQDQRMSENPAKARKVSEQRSNGQASKQGASPSMSRRTTTNSQPNGRRAIDEGSAARKFVLQMHNAGYSFEQLAKEVPDHKALRSMYKALNLPLPSESAVAHVPQIDGTVPSPLQQPRLNGIATNGAQPLAVGDRKVSATSRPAPAKPAPSANREQYLAKLAKLKTKPAASTVTPAIHKSVEQPTPAVTMAVTDKEPIVLPAAPAPSTQPAASKSVVKTELIKERLAKLKAEQAAKTMSAQPSSDAPIASSPLAQPAPPPASSIPQPPSFAAYNGLGAGLSEISAKASSSTQPPASGLTAMIQPQATQYVPAQAQTVFSSAPPTPSRQGSALPGLFSLPGLFMDGGPTQPSPPVQQSPASIRPPPPVAKLVPLPVVPGQLVRSSVGDHLSGFSPAPSPAPLNVARRRPVAADFDNEVPMSAAPTTSKRTVFGQSRSNSESERLVIEVSEDEDEDDDGEVDAEPVPVVSATKPFHSVGNLPNFPPKPNFSSAPGTPVGVTPGTAAEYAQRMKANQLEMERMKRTIAEKMAEQEAKKLAKSKGATGVQAGSTPTSGKSTPMLQATAAKASAPLTVDTATTNGSKQKSTQSMSVAALAREQEMASLMVRQQQVTEQLSRASSASVAPSSASGEPVMGALPGSEAVFAETAHDGANAVAQAVEMDVDTATNGEQMDVSSEEEGEMSHDALEMPEPTDGVVTGLGVPDDDDKIGSQASTVGTSQPGLENATLARASDGISEAVDGVTNTVTTESNDEDALENGIGIDEPMDEESSDEDGEENDLDGLDGPVPQTAEITNVAVDNDQNGEEGLIQDDTSSASSTRASDDDEEEYEPELIRPDANGTGEAIAAFPDVNTDKAIVVQRPADDDLAPELQPAKEQQTAIVDDQEPRPRISHFKPYESPLTRFHDYRYHPDYLNNVSKGFRSMTYSHRIDSNKMLCPYEAAGGKCNDKSCEHQHFHTMAITDTALLQELGTSRMPAKGAAEEKRWKEGLGAVVKQLRTTNIGRDANAIAARIAEYRRDFLGDPTKTLNLG
ncbi:hypothetical protein LTR85_002382 [Meristemomyces frigidus]|nr:hypothetical protein LTR85_002382 [Meristemomyces frigidus]